MDEAEFSRRVQALQHHIGTIQREIRDPHFHRQQELLVETLEELRVAEEELRNKKYRLGPDINWNLGAERILGYRGDEIVGQPFSLLFTPEDREKAEPACSGVGQHPRPAHSRGESQYRTQ